MTILAPINPALPLYPDNVDILNQNMIEISDFMLSQINVRNFGAIGDGVNDDTQAFYDAVDAIGPIGGKIAVPYGIYNLTTFPDIGYKSIFWDIDPGVIFNGDGYPVMSTNMGQVPVGPYIRSQSSYVSPINNGGIAAYNIEMLQPNDYIGQSVGLYVGASGSNPNYGSNVWAINGLIKSLYGAGGTYQCVELDIDNYSPTAKMKGISVSGIGDYNPDVAFEAVRADETRWKVGMELHHHIVGIILHGNINTKYEAIKIENLNSTNTTNKSISTKYYGRTFNSPTTHNVAEIEVSPMDSNWTNTRYTISLRVNSTIQSILEAKNEGIFFGLNNITQTHKIRQGNGSTQFRNTPLQYVEIKTDDNYHYITTTTNDLTGGGSGKDIKIQNKNENGVIYEFNGVEVGKITKDGKILIGKTSDNGSMLQVYNASESGNYITVNRGSSGIYINLDSLFNAITSSGKVMKIGTTDSLPLSLFANGLERVRVNYTGDVGINKVSPNYKLDVNGAFGFSPGSSVTPVNNGDVVFEFTNNTTFTIKAKGGDGVTRTSTIPLL